MEGAVVRLPYTPTSHIRHALRLLWMRSRERVEALRNTDYHCSVCWKKQSKANGKECKLDVHHVAHKPDWSRLIAVVREELLQTPEALAPLCGECHAKIHAERKS